MRRESQAGTSDSAKSPFGLVRFLIKDWHTRVAGLCGLHNGKLCGTYNFERRFSNAKSGCSIKELPSSPSFHPMSRFCSENSETPHRMFGVKRLSNPIKITRRQIIGTIRHAAVGCSDVGKRRIILIRITCFIVVHVRRMTP